MPEPFYNLYLHEIDDEGFMIQKKSFRYLNWMEALYALSKWEHSAPNRHGFMASSSMDENQETIAWPISVWPSYQENENEE